MTKSERMNISQSIAHVLQPKTTRTHLYSTELGLLAHCNEGDTTWKRTMGQAHNERGLGCTCIKIWTYVGNVKKGSRKHSVGLSWVLSQHRSYSTLGYHLNTSLFSGRQKWQSETERVTGEAASGTHISPERGMLAILAWTGLLLLTACRQVYTVVLLLSFSIHDQRVALSDIDSRGNCLRPTELHGLALRARQLQADSSQGLHFSFSPWRK